MTKSSTESTTLSKKRRVSHAGAAKKGKQFEREIAHDLGHIFPEAERNLEYQASNCIGVDLNGTDRIKIQCKNYANYCPIGKINEIRNIKEDDIPVLVTKGIRMEPMAVLPWKKLVTLLEIAYGLELPFRTFDVKPIVIPSTFNMPLDSYPTGKISYVDSVYPDTSDRSALLDDII